LRPFQTLHQKEEEPMARDSKRRQNEEEGDYEVVDDKPKHAPKSRGGGEDERPRVKRRDVEEENAPRRRNRDETDDDDDRPRSKKRTDDEEDSRPDEDDYEEEDRPRRKKKKKKKKPPVDPSLPLEEKPRKTQMDVGDWMIAGMFFGTGIIMCFVAAVGIAGVKQAWIALFVMFVYFLLLLPVSIGALMGVGIVMNIDYGEWKVAILKLAAISSFNNGIIWMGDWIGLPFFITLCFCAFILFGLLMALFDLDAQEALTTVGTLNVIQFVAYFILIGLALLQARHEEKKYNRGDYDDAPKYKKKIDPDFGKGNGRMPDDDDPDDEMPFPP
jgi:hypothetical protein